MVLGRFSRRLSQRAVTRLWQCERRHTKKSVIAGGAPWPSKTRGGGTTARAGVRIPELRRLRHSPCASRTASPAPSARNRWDRSQCVLHPRVCWSLRKAQVPRVTLSPWTLSSMRLCKHVPELLVRPPLELWSLCPLDGQSQNILCPWFLPATFLHFLALTKRDFSLMICLSL